MLPSKLDRCRSYLWGALHDGTTRVRTIRICQKERAYVTFVQRLIRDAGGCAWTYREGAGRNLYIVGFSRSFLGASRPTHPASIVDYVRGYFDAEGGTPRRRSVAPYLYFAQKNRKDLAQLRSMLTSLGIRCGRIHQPSWRSDPRYWRFYVSRGSHRRFGELIGSWHPRKALALGRLMDKRVASGLAPREPRLSTKRVSIGQAWSPKLGWGHWSAVGSSKASGPLSRPEGTRCPAGPGPA